MAEAAYDDERALRTALGTLLADEPSPMWAVADDVERGRAYRARRRARVGGGIALVSVIALVVGIVAPLRAGDSSTPLPLGSATPSSQLTGAALSVVNYLNDQGWPVSGARLEVSPTDGSLQSASFAVQSATPPSTTAVLSLKVFDSPPARDLRVPVTAGSRVGSALQRCGAACASVSVTTQDCVAGALTCYDSEVTAWVSRTTDTFTAGDLIVERTWSDGTQLEAVASARECAACRSQVSSGAIAPGAGSGGLRPGSSFLTLDQVERVLDLTGKPRTGARSTAGTDSFGAEPMPNPYDVERASDPVWLKDSLAALSVWVEHHGSAATTDGSAADQVGLQHGLERAWLQLTSASTTADAPECRAVPSCTVLQPWTSARGGTVQVAVTETTVPPGTTSTALRGPSYQLLIRRGHRLVRLDEGTTFPTLFDGQRPGFVLTWQQLLAAGAEVRFPSEPSPSSS